MSDVTDRFQANAQQAAYWQANGIKWVQYRESMDARMRPLTVELLRRAAAQPGERVLDIGCGSGATSQHLAEAVGLGGRVLGLDISEPMLAAARERCRGLAQVGFLQGDAQTHDFGQDTFDLLVSRFGVMFFADPVAAFRNLHGALHHGARLCFVCWAPLADNAWFQIPLEASMAHLEPPEPTPPRAPGPLAFSEPPYVEDMLRAAGFEHLRIERFATAMSSAESLESQAEFFLHFGPAARFIAAQQPSQDIIAAIVKSIADGLTPYADASGIAVPATVFYVSAVKA